MVVAGAFMVSVSCKDEVESATLLVPAVRLLMLLEVAPVFGLVQLRIDEWFANLVEILFLSETFFLFLSPILILI